MPSMFFPTGRQIGARPPASYAGDARRVTQMIGENGMAPPQPNTGTSPLQALMTLNQASPHWVSPAWMDYTSANPTGRRFTEAVGESGGAWVAGGQQTVPQQPGATLTPAPQNDGQRFTRMVGENGGVIGLAQQGQTQTGGMGMATEMALESGMAMQQQPASPWASFQGQRLPRPTDIAPQTPYGLPTPAQQAALRRLPEGSQQMPPGFTPVPPTEQQRTPIVMGSQFQRPQTNTVQSSGPSPQRPSYTRNQVGPTTRQQRLAGARQQNALTPRKPAPANPPVRVSSGITPPPANGKPPQPQRPQQPWEVAPPAPQPPVVGMGLGGPEDVQQQQQGQQATRSPESYGGPDNRFGITTGQTPWGPTVSVPPAVGAAHNPGTTDTNALAAYMMYQRMSPSLPEAARSGLQQLLGGAAQEATQRGQTAGSMVNSLAQDTQRALNEYNASVAQRDDLIRRLYGQRSENTFGWQGASAANLSNDYWNRQNTAMDIAQGIGASDLQNITDLFKQQRAKTLANLTNRGLGNTTILGSMMQGLTREEGKAMGEALDRIARLRLQTYLGSSGDRLTAAERLHQERVNLERTMPKDLIDYLERIDPQPPNVAGMINLAHLAGQAGNMPFMSNIPWQASSPQYMVPPQAYGAPPPGVMNWIGGPTATTGGGSVTSPPAPKTPPAQTPVKSYSTESGRTGQPSTPSSPYSRGSANTAGDIVITIGGVPFQMNPSASPNQPPLIPKSPGTESGNGERPLPPKSYGGEGGVPPKSVSESGRPTPGQPKSSGAESGQPQLPTKSPGESGMVQPPGDFMSGGGNYQPPRPDFGGGTHVPPPPTQSGWDNRPYFPGTPFWIPPGRPDRPQGEPGFRVPMPQNQQDWRQQWLEQQDLQKQQELLSKLTMFTQKNPGITVPQLQQYLSAVQDAYKAGKKPPQPNVFSLPPSVVKLIPMEWRREYRHSKR